MSILGCTAMIQGGRYMFGKADAKAAQMETQISLGYQTFFSKRVPQFTKDALIVYFVSFVLTML